MPTVEIPLAGVFKNVDQEELTDSLWNLIDGYVDEFENVRRRPGLHTIYDFGVANSPIDGLYWWSNLSCLIVVCAGNVYKVTKSGSTYTITNLTGGSLLAGNRVSFATDGTYVFMANGGLIHYTNGTALVQAISDGDAPTAATHVDWIDGYLLATNSNNRFYFSNVNDSLNWSALDFATASRNADNIVALLVKERDIHLIGSLSVEIWQNDGENPFSPIAGGALNTGCIAPGSIIRARDGIWWLSDTREIVKFSGGGVQVISTPYDKEIEQFGTVSDCLGDYIKIDGKRFLVFNFPSEDRTLVFCITTEKWSEWGYWNSSAGEYERMLMSCYAYCPDWGVHIVGDRESSVINQLSSDNLDDNGDEIRLAITTGHLDWGDSRSKRGGEFRLRCRGGVGLSDRTPVLAMRYRDNGNSSWSNERTIDLGDVGETEIVKRLPVRGFFRTRQFEFVGSDAVPMIVARPEFDIEVFR